MHCRNVKNVSNIHWSFQQKNIAMNTRVITNIAFTNTIGSQAVVQG